MMPPLKLMARALWESFKARTPAQRLERARLRLKQADILEHALISELQRMLATPGKSAKQRRRLRRARRRLTRIQRRTDRLAVVVGQLAEVVN